MDTLSGGQRPGGGSAGERKGPVYGDPRAEDSHSESRAARKCILCGGGAAPASELPLGSPSTGPVVTVLPLPLRWPREPRRLCRHSLGTQLEETANLSACVTSGIFCVHSDIDLEFTCAHLRAADSERALIWLGAHPSCFGGPSSSPLPRSELSWPGAGRPFCFGKEPAGNPLRFGTNFHPCISTPPGGGTL